MTYRIFEMVRIGNFKLELVSADTSAPFKEHTQNTSGEKFAEVEPESEYFIRFQNRSSNKVIIKLSVDGNSLGYTKSVHGGGSSKIMGLRYADHYKALKFNKLYKRVGNETPTDAVLREYWTGSVEVKVYEYVEKPGKNKRKSFESSRVHKNKRKPFEWQPNSEAILNGLHSSNNKKACNSIKGEVKLVRDKPTGTRYESHRSHRGSQLATIKLNYCSTVGLIAANILKSTPAPDISQILSTVPNERIKLEGNSPKRRKQNNAGKSQTQEVNTIIMTRTETYEIIDLTND